MLPSECQYRFLHSLIISKIIPEKLSLGKCPHHQHKNNSRRREDRCGDKPLLISGRIDLLPVNEDEPDTDDICAVIHRCYDYGSLFLIAGADFIAPAWMLLE
jgi:hypothetical protein